ncbi:TIGR03915 family putative DNA repair protein [Natronospora cellulosivora (SeqCode)]
MNYYLYDGSFPGMLTAVYQAFYARENLTNIIYCEDYQTGLFDKKINVETDLDKSDKVYKAIKEKISLDSLKKIYYCYLSEEKKSGQYIYQYLRLGFKIGNKIDNYLNHDIVDKVYKLSNKVAKEKHLLLGLLRFRKMENGFFYAPFEPDYNIITLLAPHFAGRLADQQWLIHDKKRDIAILYNKKEWVLTEYDQSLALNYTEDEAYYQELWQNFYENIAIKNRNNPRVQKQFMPKRYWKHLVEKN